MRLGDIAAAVNGTLLPASACDILIDRVSTDSRNIDGGELFFALIGERDGHDFVASAAEAGIAAAVVSRMVSTDVPQILVGNTLDVLGKFAGAYRKSLEIPVIAVTGSLGKTTTRELIAFLLETKYHVAQSEKNFNNLIGLPLTILAIDETHEVAVIELGINITGEMAILGGIASPEYAAILNIAPVHIEGLGSIESIAREKIELLKHLRPDGRAFLFADDERLMAQDIVPRDRVISFGYSETADYRIELFKPFDGMVQRFAINGREYSVGIPGKGIIHAAACAVAVAMEFDVSDDDISSRLAQFHAPPGRLNLIEIDGVVIIDDLYNSSPVAAINALEALSRIEGRRKLAVLGDMLELGRDEARYHAEMGEFAARSGADFVFFFGNLVSAAAKMAIYVGMPPDRVFWTDDYDELEAAVEGRIETGDVVLIKGSRGMHLERLLEAMKGAKCVE